MTFEITTENNWRRNVLWSEWNLVEIGYDCVNLCQKQHTLTFVLLGLGFSILWRGPEDKKCKRRLEKDLWDDEPQIKPKKKKRKS